MVDFERYSCESSDVIIVILVKVDAHEIRMRSYIRVHWDIEMVHRDIEVVHRCTVRTVRTFKNGCTVLTLKFEL